MYLGIHSGSLKTSLKLVSNLEVNSIQIMPSAPMKWITKPIPDENIDEFSTELKKSRVKKILIHGIYLTNLAREDKQLFHLGKMGLIEYLDFAEKLSKRIEDLDIEVLGVCFHPGSQKELPYDESIERISHGIQLVLDQIPGKQKLLIETTAGSGSSLGGTFEELKRMRDGVKDKERVGYVVDTQHTFASGYDWKEDFDGVVKLLDDILGIENIKAFHLNDSMTLPSSKKDRHADLGKGNLGEETIRKILHEKRFKDIPFILETPAVKGGEELSKEIEKLISLSK